MNQTKHLTAEEFIKENILYGEVKDKIKTNTLVTIASGFISGVLLLIICLTLYYV